MNSANDIISRFGLTTEENEVVFGTKENAEKQFKDLGKGIRDLVNNYFEVATEKGHDDDWHPTFFLILSNGKPISDSNKMVCVNIPHIPDDHLRDAPHMIRTITHLSDVIVKILTNNGVEFPINEVADLSDPNLKIAGIVMVVEGKVGVKKISGDVDPEEIRQRMREDPSSLAKDDALVVRLETFQTEYSSIMPIGPDEAGVKAVGEPTLEHFVHEGDKKASMTFGMPPLMETIKKIMQEASEDALELLD